MSIETNVPLNSLVVGQRYKFYFSQGSLVNPVYATASNIVTNPPQIVLINVVDAVTNNAMPGSYSYPMNWINRVTINNIGPMGTGLNKYINQYLGGRKKKRRSLKRRKSRRQKSRRTKRRKH